MAEMLSKRLKNVLKYDGLQLNGSVISFRHKKTRFGMPHLSTKADDTVSGFETFGYASSHAYSVV